MAANSGASTTVNADYSESESESEWMPFCGTTPDLPHSKHWDSDGFVSPFQATPVHKIATILTHLNLTEADVVYDLGCGDGRVLVECTRASNCSGVGIDLDDRLVQRAQANALRHRVEHRITFRKADILDPNLDLSSATVLFLYLLPEALSLLLGVLENLANDSRSQLKKIVSVRWPLPGVPATTSDAVDNFYIYEAVDLRS
ncbi:putative RNA methylase [Besnoitia besnoiti]|uniref:Putative RNA methylase n=1 Tax=Besnoitia besnoiti TaxID=94643 RepID=A0A2A9M7B1_BESBE|nr:putative RNA methylase [Besnoitia besnoiti]PFH32191.1 putative RNA methylase [Besnoitia besnoiti]